MIKSYQCDVCQHIFQGKPLVDPGQGPKDLSFRNATPLPLAESPVSQRDGSCFHCTLCCESFHNKIRLDDHGRSAHGVDNPEGSRQGPYLARNPRPLFVPSTHVVTPTREAVDEDQDSLFVPSA